MQKNKTKSILLFLDFSINQEKGNVQLQQLKRLQ